MHLFEELEKRLDGPGKNVDWDKIRHVDRDFLTEVVGYLEFMGLDVEVRGSATKDRKYDDIDLLVTKDSNHEGMRKVIHNLEGYLWHGLKEGVPKFAEKVENYNHGLTKYVNTYIEHDFKINDGRTKIHLNFEGLRDKDWYDTCMPAKVIEKKSEDNYLEMPFTVSPKDMEKRMKELEERYASMAAELVF